MLYSLGGHFPQMVKLPLGSGRGPLPTREQSIRLSSLTNITAWTKSFSRSLSVAPQNLYRSVFTNLSPQMVRGKLLETQQSLFTSWHWLVDCPVASHMEERSSPNQPDQEFLSKDYPINWEYWHVIQIIQSTKFRSLNNEQHKWSNQL